MTIQKTLKQYFGYDAFREGQEPLINDILKGKDVLGIMPTGAGKSLCFQIPALILEGITLVISPLISLMKDQVNALNQSGISAAFINSSLAEYEIHAALSDARNGAFKLIYIAPERLLAPNFLSFAKSAEISMLTVDEAHCISQWGQDFRPSYSQIPQFIGELKTRPVTAAFTATATPVVREDIVNQLGLKEPTVLVSGFDRTNLYFEVQKPLNESTKRDALTAFLQDRKEQSGIVYCSTRSTVEDICNYLKEKDYNAARYHAGLHTGERSRNQEAFLHDRVKIIVATNAFGMGIDKSNVSFVVHYNMPKDVESYYQEAGRAGRDGEPADCLLLYSKKDVETNRWLISNSDNGEIVGAQQKRLSKEREYERLKEMTFYCTTKDCLRRYMLKYFGENPPYNCGNCGNCNTNFEEADVTLDAKKILSCVGRMQQRSGRHYGVKMIADVLRGRKNDRVIQLGFDKLSTYKISEKSEQQLREIISHLIQTDCLIQANDEYPVIKFGARANGVLREDATVIMKLSKSEEKHMQKAQKAEQSNLRPVDKRLYGILSALRSEIAQEQKVPAFTIFSNSTLTDMCMKLPSNTDEFLNVSGVGKVKSERYGMLFMEAIAEFTENNGAPDIPAYAEPPAAKAFDTANIEISDEPVTVSVISDRINCVLMESGYGKITARKINDWLISRGYLEFVQENGGNRKIPTASGEELGVISEERVIRGANMRINLFPSAAQRFWL